MESRILPIHSGAEENPFAFARSKKTRRIIPVKCIVPCKHISDGESGGSDAEALPVYFGTRSGGKISDSGEIVALVDARKRRDSAMKAREIHVGGI